MKKLIIVVILSLFLCVKVHAMGVSAESAILMDLDSGRVLFEKDKDKVLPTASIAKLLTAITAIEHGDLEEIVKIEKNTTLQIGSSLYLQEDDEIKLMDLVYGLVLRSGNDAAYQIAVSVGGSLDGFVYLMNEKAKRIGMQN